MELTICFFQVIKGISEGNKETEKGVCFLLSPNLENIEDRTFDIIFTNSGIHILPYLLTLLSLLRSQTNSCVHANAV